MSQGGAFHQVRGQGVVERQVLPGLFIQLAGDGKAGEGLKGCQGVGGSIIQNTGQ